MINHLTGIISHYADDHLIITTGPIGFDIQVPQGLQFVVGQQITLYLHMNWNQEQGPSLFGFATVAQRTLFQLIISCSGIGPKIGLSILSQLSPAEFIESVQTGNEKLLSSVHGIGTKKAEQMIVQLKHKLEKVIDTDFADEVLSGRGAKDRQQLAQVLKSLHYSKAEVTDTLRYLQEHGDHTASFDQLMRQALAFLAKKI